MRLEVLPAKKGDCLLVHCGTDAAPALILVDGGPAGVWKGTLLPRLERLRRERGLGPEQPLHIDLVIVSHVDDDHINGVIGLLEHLKEKRDRRDPPPFTVGRLWHNAFDDVLGNDQVPGDAAAQFGVASVGSGADTDDACEPRAARDVAKLLASVEQGDRLRDLADALGIEVNGDFKGGIIHSGAPTINDPGLGLRISVAGPRHDELLALQAETDRWLRERARKDAAAGSLLAALDDTSVANLSSVVLLLRDAEGTLLLTGDARADKIKAGLADAGELQPEGTIHVDILKMQHHGSIRNVDGEFLRTVTADTYVFSGDGKHGNPDRETFELLFAERPGAAMTLVTTYPLDEIDAERAREHAKEQRKRAAKGKDAGADWDDARDALGALLRPPPEGVIIVAPDGTPRT
jgi:hypothetical protein